MHGITPSEQDRDNAALEKRRWDAAEGQSSEQHLLQNLRRTRDPLLPRLLSGQVNLAEN